MLILLVAHHRHAGRRREAAKVPLLVTSPIAKATAISARNASVTITPTFEFMTLRKR